jgi:hypothetical protein
MKLKKYLKEVYVDPESVPFNKKEIQLIKSKYNRRDEMDVETPSLIYIKTDETDEDMDGGISYVYYNIYKERYKKDPTKNCYRFVGTVYTQPENDWGDEYPGEEWVSKPFSEGDLNELRANLQKVERV